MAMYIDMVFFTAAVIISYVYCMYVVNSSLTLAPLRSRPVNTQQSKVDTGMGAIVHATLICIARTCICIATLYVAFI